MVPSNILLMGGSLRAASVSEQVLSACTAMINGAGRGDGRGDGRNDGRSIGDVASVLTARDLALPLYDPDRTERTGRARRLVTALRLADGVIIVTPTYHGAMSGLLKNALDYAEDLDGDDPPYLQGRVVGCVAVAWGERGGAAAVDNLRTTVHALHGWTTPMSVVVNSADTPFHGGLCDDPKTVRRLDILVDQVREFAAMRARPRPDPLDLPVLDVAG